MKLKWKLRISLSLIGLVILSCGIAVAIYLNSDGWKNRGGTSPASQGEAVDSQREAVDSQGGSGTTPGQAAAPEVLEALAMRLEEWTGCWKSGDISALSGSMVFFSAQEYPMEDLPERVIPIRDEDFQKELSEKFGDLLEDTPEVERAGENGQNITALLLPYANVTYTLPAELTVESVVEFQIESPDIAAMFGAFTAENYKSSTVLFGSIQTLLEHGTYEKKLHTILVKVLQSGNSWMLADSFELADALYGGLLSISREQTSAAMDAILSQIDAEKESKTGTEGIYE